MSDSTPWSLRCVETGERYAGDELRYRSESGGLLEVEHDLEGLTAEGARTLFRDRSGAMGGPDASGVWRYRELVLPVEHGEIVTMQEGNTPLYCSEALSAWTGVNWLALKHEGHNPTGSFKDRGMTAGVTAARRLGQTAVACASTGNTSASMAAYAASCGLKAFVFIPAGGIAMGKLAQAIAYGSEVVQIRGNFDDAMRLVQEVCSAHGVYLLNSINPYRIEGQKAIGIEMMHQLDWLPPDWIVVPGGNLGNSSAIFKGLRELRSIGVIDRLPRIAVIQAAGAAPLHQGFQEAFSGGARTVPNPETLASAIRIGSPVSWGKCVDAIQTTDGVVEAVTDDEIMAAKRRVDASGIGAEPASCASVAGLRKLVESGTIDARARVVCVLTGHVLKDTDAVLRGRENVVGDAAGCEPTLSAIGDRIERALEEGAS
ncbi:MAG: threonine synthase [Planctomycetota bacterium]